MSNQVEACTAREKAISKWNKEQLSAEVRRHHRVVDLRGVSKWELIAMLLRAEYGVKVLRQVPGWS